MARTSTAPRAFVSLLAAHNLTLEHGSAHIAVLKNGKRVATLSHSPKDTNAYRQCVRDLCRSQLLPQSAKRERF